MNKPSAVKGFADLYTPESTLYTLMEDTARRVFGTYGYEELRIPILEYTELFSRSIGTETDVVQKEMFTLSDRKGRSLSMRPEATAGIMRSYIENNRHAKEAISRFFCYGPMFRYERPQKGRLRQFHQLDCECLGSGEPHVDAEMILMLMGFLSALGLTGLTLELNTLGCHECRPVYKEQLTTYLRALDTNSLCEDCKRRLDTNPLRVLDCKVPSCKALTIDAPNMGDNVCEACASHFAVVKRLLDAHQLSYQLNPRLVRGLDYYTRTTFEVVSSSIGAQGSVAGGGRYDGLLAQLGGPDIPGIGFACGMERLALALGDKTSTARTKDFYVALLDDAGADTALKLAQILRESGLYGDAAFTARSMKSNMRQASKTGVRFCLLLGGAELETKAAVIKNMETGDQVTVSFTSLADWAKAALPA